MLTARRAATVPRFLWFPSEVAIRASHCRGIIGGRAAGRSASSRCLSRLGGEGPSLSTYPAHSVGPWMIKILLGFLLSVLVWWLLTDRDEPDAEQTDGQPTDGQEADGSSSSSPDDHLPTT